VKRREFITLLGGAAAAWPVLARGQQGERMRRIGILMPYLPTNAEMQARVRAFREELRKRGWAASVNAQFDERWTSDNMDLVRSAAASLVELNPDVIMASGARVVPILMELTRSIPIVTPSGTDAVARGYAGNVARPGGNVTGFASMEVSIIGKLAARYRVPAIYFSAYCAQSGGLIGYGSDYAEQSRQAAGSSRLTSRCKRRPNSSW
jgi:putative ABC transport system substrate-binding protein